MGSGGKGGGDAFKSYNYHSTLAGAVCWGPVDTVHAVIVDGKSIWEGTSNRPSSPTSAPAGKAALASPTLNSEYTELTASIDPKWFLTGGYLRVYWGTTTQTVDPAFVGHGHSGYAGTSYLVARKFLLGRERSSAPNIEVVVSRKPVATTDVVAAIDNVIDDLNCNPVAALAELFTSQHGLGLPAARLDATSWLAAAAWCNASADRRAATFCSPLFTGSKLARVAAAELLAMFDGGLGWTADGLLALRLLEFGVDPGGLATLDAGQITDAPRMKAGGWGDVPSGVIVGYVDRARKHKVADEKVDNLVALRVFGEDRRDKLDRPHVVRREQAVRHGAEFLRRTSSPRVTVDITCRREMVAGLAPGSKVLVDVDPEPGGAGLAQLVVVEERRDDGKGEVRLSCIADNLVPAVPYTPTLTADAPQAMTMDPIEHALAIPLSPKAWGDGGRIGVLAARPQSDAIGFRVFLSADGTEFAEVGSQPGFAVRATLDTAIDLDAETVRLSLTDGATGRDAYLIEQSSPGGNEAEARNDQLIIVLANVGVDGRVVITDGHAELEIMSVIARTAIDADTHDYDVYRSRMGTESQDWATTCEAWVLPGANLTAWTHPDLWDLLGTTDPAYVRMVAYSNWAEDEDETVPEREVVFPRTFDSVPRIDWVTPSGTLGLTDVDGDYVIQFDVTDNDGDVVRVYVASRDTSGAMTEWLDLPLTGDATVNIDHELLALPPGSHSLIVEVTDRAGHVTTDNSRTIQNTNAPEGGGTILPVAMFDPPSGTEFTTGVTVTITGSSPNDRLEWSLTYQDVAVPGTVTAVSALTTTVNITGTRKLWARAGNGTIWSDWVFAYYDKRKLGGEHPV